MSVLLLPDEIAILSLANRYTDAVNSRDWDRYRSCWTEDAVWELGPPVSRREEGIDAIMTEVQRAVGAMDLFVQMNHAVSILEVGDNVARARATLNEVGRVKQECRDLLDGAQAMSILATYTDDLRRTEEGWKYARRSYRVLYFDSTALPGIVLE